MLIHWSTVVLWGLMGTVCGSFINVVAYRLPIILQRSWKKEAEAILHDFENSADEAPLLPKEPQTEEPLDSEAKERVYNLAKPRSQCPSCKTNIAWYDNIPIISWLVLRAKCRHCQFKIPVRYPFVELLGAISGVYAYLTVMPTSSESYLIALATAIFLLFLIALAATDAISGLLPDDLTLPMLWLGLLAAYMGYTYPTLEEALIGAVLSYCIPFVIIQIFYVLTGKYGMGGGDVKMMAAMGAWLGFQQLPIVVLIASLLALLYTLYKRTQGDDGRILRFGPALAVGGAITLVALDHNLLFQLI